MPAAIATGRIESINLAVVSYAPWTGTKLRSGIDKRPADGAVRLDVAGVAGDTVCDLDNHGGPDQAVYAYSTDDLAFWAAELDRPVGPGQVGENLTVSGVDCSHAVLGERWRIGDVRLVVRGPRIPCRVFAGFLDVPDLVKRFIAARLPGCYLAVEQPGEVRVGDGIEVLDRPAHGVTVADLMAAMTTDRDRTDRVAAARADMGARGREWLDRMLVARERGRRAAS